MERVVSFYEKLPRGPAPEPKATGLLSRYQNAYFGNKPSAMRESLHTSGDHRGNTEIETSSYCPRYRSDVGVRLQHGLLLSLA